MMQIDGQHGLALNGDAIASMSIKINHPSAQVRVYLPTYRRARLLKRAVASLRAQSFTDWVCELHNDDPNDVEPAKLLAAMQDSRFTLCQHEQNLGGTQTFNLFFRGTNEPYYSILEDDNSWEPRFLEIMLKTAEANPDVTVFWCNQRVWQEQPDGSIKDTGRLVHSYSTSHQPIRIDWGQPSQIYGALHANGAALIRSHPDQDFTIPAIPFAGIELFRERMFPHPLVFVPEPLANFSITLQSHRSDKPQAWAIIQFMIASSFLKYATYSEAEWIDLWSDARARKPPSISTLLYASLIEPACRQLLRYAQWRDWLLLVRTAVRRPHVSWSLFRCRKRHANWWSFLDKHTAERFEQIGKSSKTKNKTF